MYVLPVTEQEAKDLTPPDPPKGYVNASDDYVSFVAEPVDKQASQRLSGRKDFTNAACYAVLLPHLEHYDITCLPRNKGATTLEEAQEFFEIMQAYNIIPAGIRLSAAGKGGVQTHIPAGLGNPHLIYAALTCYRWVDCHPPLVWQYLYLHRHGIGGAPWRLLPYLINKHVTNQNHSFIYAYNPNYMYCGPGSQVGNPLIPLGVRAYFTQATPKLKEIFESPTSAVNSSIKDYTTGITPTNIKFGKTLYTFGVREPVHLLHPTWEKLLEVNPTTKDEAEKILAQICTEKELVKEKK